MTTASPVALVTDTDMNDNGKPQSGATSSWRNAPTRSVAADGVDYAYRELGPKAGVPVIFLVHLAGTLDNWDPRVVDGIAQSTGSSPSTTGASVPPPARRPTQSRRWPRTPSRSSAR